MLLNFVQKDSVAFVHCTTDILVMQVAPNPNGQGDGLGPSAAPAPPIPPCTKEPWLCPTVHNPYYNYFSNLRCGRNSILSVSFRSPYVDTLYLYKPGCFSQKHMLRTQTSLCLS